MAIEKVREFFRDLGMEERIQEFDVSSATVELAAQAVGVEGARICKTLSFKDGEDGCILIQTAGDTKIDNRKFRSESENADGRRSGGIYRTCHRRRMRLRHRKSTGEGILRRIHEAVRNGISGVRKFQQCHRTDL